MSQFSTIKKIVNKLTKKTKLNAIKWEAYKLDDNPFDWHWEGKINDDFTCYYGWGGRLYNEIFIIRNQDGLHVLSPKDYYDNFLCDDREIIYFEEDDQTLHESIIELEGAIIEQRNNLRAEIREEILEILSE